MTGTGFLACLIVFGFIAMVLYLIYMDPID